MGKAVTATSNNFEVDQEPILARLATVIPDWLCCAQSTNTGERMRALLLDTIGCVLGGRGHSMVEKLCATLPTAGQSTGLATGAARDPISATLENGAAIRALDLNDFYWGTGIGGHPSDLFAPLLVLAESHGRRLGDLLSAAAVGYELYLRLLDRMRGDGPFDHCFAAMLGATAGGAAMLQLNPTATAQALAIAVTQGPPMIAVRYGQISETKGLAAALASVKALLALQMAGAGLTGPVQEASGTRGLLALLDPSKDAIGLASPFADRQRDVAIKRYACIGTAQPAVAAAVELNRKLAAEGTKFDRVTVHLTDNSIARHQTTDAYRVPETRETADHSFFALVAMALADGDLTPAQFERGRFRDAEIRDLANRLDFVFDLPPYPDGSFAARAVAQLPSGQLIEVKCDAAPGHPQNPLSRNSLIAKFKSLAAPHLGEGTDALASLCLDGAAQTPIHQLMQQVVDGRNV